jgi:hypothetical protein
MTLVPLDEEEIENPIKWGKRDTIGLILILLLWAFGFWAFFNT